MSKLLETIRERGYWKVVIRPSTFVEKRVLDKGTLAHIIEKNAVSYKGWNFPHLDDFRDADEGPDWIGQEIDWKPILELWRFYQSGQFVHYFGMVEAWDESLGRLLPQTDDESRPAELRVESALERFTEIFEFAARLSFTDAGDAAAWIEISVGNIDNCVLLALPQRNGSTVWFHRSKKPSKTIVKELSSTELVADRRELAVKSALDFFECFKWKPRPELLRDIQSVVLGSDQAQPVG